MFSSVALSIERYAAVVHPFAKYRLVDTNTFFVLLFKGRFWYGNKLILEDDRTYPRTAAIIFSLQNPYVRCGSRCCPSLSSLPSHYICLLEPTTHIRKGGGLKESMWKFYCRAARPPELWIWNRLKRSNQTILYLILRQTFVNSKTYL